MRSARKREAETLQSAARVQQRWSLCPNRAPACGSDETTIDGIDAAVGGVAGSGKSKRQRVAYVGDVLNPAVFLRCYVLNVPLFDSRPKERFFGAEYSRRISAQINRARRAELCPTTSGEAPLAEGAARLRGNR